MKLALSQDTREMLNKVPEITLAFWIIKILATTVGETAADLLSSTLGLGLPVTSVIMTVLFIAALVTPASLSPLRTLDLL
jgi:uncharacterized membrane-anchored protein